MKNPTPQQVSEPAVTRIKDVMVHTTRYAFRGVSRLAFDAGITPSALSRVISGKRNPRFDLVAQITDALERELGMDIDPRDLVARDGRFKTRYVCDVVGCSGCLPENSHDEFGSLKPAFDSIKPGCWVTSRYPKGYVKNEEVYVSA